MNRYGRRRKENLTGANSLLAKAIGRKEVLERLEARQITQRWEEAVGEPLATKSTPEKFEHGVLTVVVISAPWAQELRLRKAELLDRLNLAAGRDLFEDLRFSVRTPAKKQEAESVPEPFEPEDLAIDVSIPEIAEIVRRALGRHRAASKRDSSADP